MKYEELKKQGTKVLEDDVYDGGIYLNTTEYWACKGILYIHENHPNINRYTGKTHTYQPTDSHARYLIDDYIPNYLEETEAAEQLKELTDYFKRK